MCWPRASLPCEKLLLRHECKVTKPMWSHSMGSDRRCVNWTGIEFENHWKTRAVVPPARCGIPADVSRPSGSTSHG